MTALSHSWHGKDRVFSAHSSSYRMSLIDPAICKLQEIMRTMPQAELPTEHFWADGMYARVMQMPSSSVVVGKVHRKEHFFAVTKGKIAVHMDDETKTLDAGAVLVSRTGTKRALVALEDSICMTVHRTKKRNLEAIERQLVEPDPLALFDAGNRLKLKELT